MYSTILILAKRVFVIKAMELSWRNETHLFFWYRHRMSKISLWDFLIWKTETLFGIWLDNYSHELSLKFSFSEVGRLEAYWIMVAVQLNGMLGIGVWLWKGLTARLRKGEPPFLDPLSFLCFWAVMIRATFLCGRLFYHATSVFKLTVVWNFWNSEPE